MPSIRFEFGTPPPRTHPSFYAPMLVEFDRQASPGQKAKVVADGVMIYTGLSQHLRGLASTRNLAITTETNNGDVWLVKL